MVIYLDIKNIIAYNMFCVKFFGGDFLRKISLNVVSAVMYFVSFFAFFILVSIDLFDDKFTRPFKFIIAVLVFACGFGATALRCFVKKDKAYVYLMVSRTSLFLFIAYLIIVVDFMLIDDSFGRNISNIFASSPEKISEYFKNKTNFIPFATIKLFCEGYKNDWVSYYAFAENILGNLIVFMPFALFVPILFRRINTALKFFVLISATVIFMELLQAVFLTGSADIDDYILNVSGAMFAYMIFRIKNVKKLLKRLTFGMWYCEDK